MNKVIVYSPRELSSEERENLSKQLLESKEKLSSEVEFVVDESLIDGLKIVYNDKMLDLSLESQIKSLKED